MMDKDLIWRKQQLFDANVKLSGGLRTMWTMMSRFPFWLKKNIIFNSRYEQLVIPTVNPVYIFGIVYILDFVD